MTEGASPKEGKPKIMNISEIREIISKETKEIIPKGRKRVISTQEWGSRLCRERCLAPASMV